MVLYCRKRELPPATEKRKKKKKKRSMLGSRSLSLLATSLLYILPFVSAMSSSSRMVSVTVYSDLA
jgi:hypothetical protein